MRSGYIGSHETQRWHDYHLLSRVTLFFLRAELYAYVSSAGTVSHSVTNLEIFRFLGSDKMYRLFLYNNCLSVSLLLLCRFGEVSTTHAAVLNQFTQHGWKLMSAFPCNSTPSNGTQAAHSDMLIFTRPHT